MCSIETMSPENTLSLTKALSYTATRGHGPPPFFILKYGVLCTKTQNGFGWRILSKCFAPYKDGGIFC